MPDRAVPPDYGVQAADVEQRTGVVLPGWYHQQRWERQAWGKKKRRQPIRKAKRQRIYERDGYRCVRCGLTEVSYLSIDHIVPVSQGGTNKDINLQTLCKTCNVAKGDRLPETA